MSDIFSRNHVYVNPVMIGLAHIPVSDATFVIVAVDIGARPKNVRPS